LWGTIELVLEHLRAHRFALSRSGSIWEHLARLVLLFRVAELFSCDFQTILHFADGTPIVLLQNIPHSSDGIILRYECSVGLPWRCRIDIVQL
jgi:hypothetical protein